MVHIHSHWNLSCGAEFKCQGYLSWGTWSCFGGFWADKYQNAFWVEDNKCFNIYLQEQGRFKILWNQTSEPHYRTLEKKVIKYRLRHETTILENQFSFMPK